jgi:hypothetical protein
MLHGGYDGAALLSDGYVLDLGLGGAASASATATAATWSGMGSVSGGPDDAPAPRSHHTLTSVGHAVVVLGGAGALGPLSLSATVLENPAVTAGLLQQHQLLEVS